MSILILLSIAGMLIGPLMVGLTIRALIVMPDRQKRQIALLASIDASLQQLTAVRDARIAQAARRKSS